MHETNLIGKIKLEFFWVQITKRHLGYCKHAGQKVVGKCGTLSKIENENAKIFVLKYSVIL